MLFLILYKYELLNMKFYLIFWLYFAEYYSNKYIILHNIIMSINTPSNVVEFKPTAKQNIQDENTKDQVNEIISEETQKHTKWDIIWALLNITNTQVDDNLAIDLLQVDYQKLLFNLYDWMCQDFWPIYHMDWLDLIFDSKDYSIYLWDVNTQEKYTKLNIALVPNEDFSETHIVISYKWNEMFFFKNNEEFWKTNYLPPQAQIKTIQEEFIESNAANDESENTLDNKYNTIFRNIITTHFPQALEIYKDEFESLQDLGNNDLYTIIVEMIYLELKDELKLQEHPQNWHFLQREVIRDEKIIFEDVQIGFDTSGKTQNIYLLNSSWEVFSEIVE